MFKESETIELKKSTSQLDSSLRDICAFANHKGGTLYYGITDDGKIIGQTVSDSTFKNISQKVYQKIKPEIQPQILEEIIEGKSVVRVFISEGANKPYSLDGIYYNRVGSETKIMSHEMLIKNIKTQIDFSWDQEICTDARYSDLDEKTILSFIDKAKRSKRLNSDKETPKEVLKKLELIKGKDITNACVLLFAKDPTKFISDAEVRCAKYKENMEFIDMQVFNENLFDNLESVMSFYKKNIRLGAKIEGLYRKEKWEYPLEALREATINALIHRSYISNSNVQVAIYDKEIVIMNIGGLTGDLTVPKLKKTHDSVLRNKLIAKTFYYSGLIERFGSGTLKIINETKTHGLTKLKFDVDDSSFHIHFIKSRDAEKKHNIELKESINISDNVSTDWDEIGRKLGESWEKVGINVGKTEIKIVQCILSNKYISQNELAKKLDLSTTAIENNFAKLKQKGLLERIGGAKGGYWKINFNLGPNKIR